MLVKKLISLSTQTSLFSFTRNKKAIDGVIFCSNLPYSPFRILLDYYFLFWGSQIFPNIYSSCTGAVSEREIYLLTSCDVIEGD